MSQPHSGCNSWLDDLVRIQDHLTQPHTSDLDNMQEPQEDEACVIHPHPDAGKVFDMDVEVGAVESGVNTKYFPHAAHVYDGGLTFMDQFDTDLFSALRRSNLFYPFASRQDWELGSWLLRSGLSLVAIDKFLLLELVKSLPLSFRTAKELRGWAELLPSGPHWQSMVIPTSFPTKSLVVLYWHDPLECIATILNNPLLHGLVDFVPYKEYSLPTMCQRYSEWITGDDAWNIQSQLPKSATLLGTILSSDKTNISAMTSDCVAHPLLIGIANIKMSTHLKLLSNSFMLTALLPVPKFIHEKKRMRGILEDRLIHQCLDIVLEPVKKAARLGVMMSDPNGHNCYCFTPLAGYITDTLEAAMLATVGGKTSLVTMAMYKQFGDPFQHKPHTASMTLAQLSIVKSKADPQDIQVFFLEAQKFRLNGVYEPFWRDMLFLCPGHFLTPEALHYFHKQCWDHDVKWCIHAVGASEFDFRFSVLQPVAGFQHFKGGISKLKQVTGSVHRDVQCYLISVIAGVLSSDFIVALRSLMDFHYCAQAYAMDEDDLNKLEHSLADFHEHKDSILASGARRGKGSHLINNWYIPKLELMQNIAPSIHCSGVAIQWTADVTEHAHIMEIKDPAQQSNNNNYDPQICRHLNRKEKLRRFDLATTFHQLALDAAKEVTSAGTMEDDEDSDDDQESEGELAHDKLSISFLALSQPLTDYFAIARLLTSSPGTAPIPLHSFSIGSIAFHLTSKPSV
ncbi:hypothetical protein SCLCIDRAFT_30621 [Scleroderma citrinum Foug A]|uniref:Uncharacterized protein n=1 Tax=Scleroderma citrinum Foug A TaxID=1036808 RepID=A0A0C3D2W2_9AGAM|nr:hypothetical protein SCLCIDRAFT_30621 [Scleroderma citrinum Foug A]